MRAKEGAIRKRFVYEGFGLPVVLENVPMVRVRGVWTPGVNFNHLAVLLLGALARKPAPLNGKEIRFIRHFFSMTLKAFAARFSVTHPAVIKWEKRGSLRTGMGWSTEKDIRLFISSGGQEKPDPKQFLELYRFLKEPPSAKPGPVRLDLSDVA